MWGLRLTVLVIFVAVMAGVALVWRGVVDALPFNVVVVIFFSMVSFGAGLLIGERAGLKHGNRISSLRTTGRDE